MTILDWITMRDYEQAKNDATNRIVKKQSRGSIFAQNGWYMSVKMLLINSRKADSDVRHIERAIKQAS